LFLQIRAGSSGNDMVSEPQPMAKGERRWCDRRAARARPAPARTRCCGWSATLAGPQRGRLWATIRARRGDARRSEGAEVHGTRKPAGRAASRSKTAAPGGLRAGSGRRQTGSQEDGLQLGPEPMARWGTTGVRRRSRPERQNLATTSRDGRRLHQPAIDRARDRALLDPQTIYGRRRRSTPPPRTSDRRNRVPGDLGGHTGSRRGRQGIRQIAAINQTLPARGPLEEFRGRAAVVDHILLESERRRARSSGSSTWRCEKVRGGDELLVLSDRPFFNDGDGATFDRIWRPRRSNRS